MTGYLKSKSEMRRRGYHLRSPIPKTKIDNNTEFKAYSLRKYAGMTSLMPLSLGKDISKRLEEQFIKELGNLPEKYDDTIKRYNKNPESSIESHPVSSPHLDEPLIEEFFKDFDEDFIEGMGDLIENYDNTLKDLVDR